MIRFSIIVPVYNVAEYLDACINSVVACTRGMFETELILVNDGSTDSSSEIIANIKADAVILKSITQENQGVSMARNTALGVATGNWILFLDGDDILHPDSLSYAYNLIKNDNFDILFYDTHRFQDGEKIVWPQASDFFEVSDVSFNFPILKSSSFGGGQIYRRSLVNHIYMGPYAYGEDMLFLAKALARAKSVAFSKKACYGYRMRKTSAMHKPRSLKYLNDLIETRLLVLKEVVNSRKSLDSYSAKWIAGELTEEFVCLLSVLRDTDRSEVLVRYRRVLKEIVNYNVGFSLLDNLRLRLLSYNSGIAMRFFLATFPRFLRLLIFRIRKGYKL